jgi:hypothetical protein
MAYGVESKFKPQYSKKKRAGLTHHGQVPPETSAFGYLCFKTTNWPGTVPKTALCTQCVDSLCPHLCVFCRSLPLRAVCRACKENADKEVLRRAACALAMSSSASELVHLPLSPWTTSPMGHLAQIHPQPPPWQFLSPEPTSHPALPLFYCLPQPRCSSAHY